MKRTLLNLVRGVSCKHGVRPAQTPAGSPVEALESRVLLSGNVLATVVHGNVRIQGDTAANAVVLDQAGLAAGQVRVTGAAGTAINGRSRPVVLSGLVHNLLIRMDAGDDAVTLNGLTLPGDLSVNTRLGLNSITIDNLDVAGGVSLRNGSKLSTTAVTGTTIGKGLGSTGGQYLAFAGVDVAGETRITTRRLGVTVTVDDSTFAGTVRLTTGRGPDVVRIDSSGAAAGPASRFAKAVLIGLNGGDDSLQLGVSGQAGNSSAFNGGVSFHGGAGVDSLRNFAASTYKAGKPAVVRSFETSALDTTAPTVTSSNPVNAKTNVPLNKRVTAVFSESMNPLTVTGATVKLFAPGNAVVGGKVRYNAVTRTATFTPTNNLALNTTYTLKVLGGVNGTKDLAGNALAVDRTSTFTTGTQAAQAPIVLGSAGTFALMATASISGTGPSVINGDVGLNPGSAQGIPPAQIHGHIHIDDQAIINAQAALLSAYNDSVSRSTTSVSLPGNMGGLTFTPGLYTNSSSVMISGVGSGNDVTLDAQGDPNAIFIFKMGTTLTTGVGSHVVLAGGAKAGNVFWQVGSSATLNTGTIFKGNVLASVTITVNSGSAIEGRLLGGANSSGSVTFNASTITVPAA